MKSLGLGARMVLLVVAGVLPLLACQLVTIYLGFRAEREKVGQQALDLARALAHAVEGEVRTRIATLEVLALSRALRAGDLPSFRLQAEAVVERQLPGSAILLVREDGQQLMNTALPEGAPLPARQDLTNQRRVFATGQPAVSDLYLGLAVARPVVAIEVPVRTPEGAVHQVLALNPTLDAFGALIRRQQPGEDWIVTVLDAAGRRVARVPGPDMLVGTLAPEEFLALRASQPFGILEVKSSEGVPLVAAFTHMEGTGWTVAVGCPLALLTIPAWRHAAVSLAIGLALLGLGLLLARWVAQGIIGPIASLGRLAASEDHGAPMPAATGLRDVDDVAAALVEESRRRRAALASLLDSERRLRLVVAELNHRAKNALATVQALAMQTARGEADPARFTAAFTARLRTLARAHDLLTAFSWEAAALDAVVRAGLAPWIGGNETRISLDFSDYTAARVSPGQAQALVLAMHELATNAVKYGALSNAEGRVALRCESLGDGSARLEWRESGGPPVPGPPARRGFGMRLLEKALARDLGDNSRVTLEFPPTGIQAIIAIAARPVRTPAFA